MTAIQQAMTQFDDTVEFSDMRLDNVETLGDCECNDPQCPACFGDCNRQGSQTLYRIDMEDRTGTVFCDDCAEDAWESGLFVD